MDPLAIALEAIPKALVYASVILSVGVPATRLLFLTRVAGPALSSTSAGPGDADVRLAFDASLARVATLAALGLLVGLLFRVWGHTAVSFGIADSFASGNLILIAWESQWGQAWKLQMAGAATLAVLAWATTQAPRLAWTPESLAAAAMCYLLPLLGHAEGEPRRVLLHGSHILGAGVWVGTLMAMALTTTAATRPLMLRAFAPFAFAGSAVLVVSGLVATWWYVRTPMNLIETTYGWTLGLKLIFVSDVAIFGFLNWRRYHGAAETSDTSAGGAGVRGSRDALVLIEVLAALAVIAVTAVLTETEHP